MLELKTQTYYRSVYGTKCYISYYSKSEITECGAFYGFFYSRGWHRMIWDEYGRVYRDSPSKLDLRCRWKEPANVKRKSPRLGSVVNVRPF